MEQMIPQDKSTKKISGKKGAVVSDSMNKTVIVEVTTLKTHPKYQKKYKATKRYKAHDEENVHKVGDIVTIIPCRPMSKEKRFKVA